MNDNMKKEIDFYEALRLVSSNNYVRVILLVLVIFFLDSVFNRFFDINLFSVIDQTLERWAAE